MNPLVRRIAAFGLTTPDADRLTDFYREAFGCRCVSNERVAGTAFEHLMNVHGGARRCRLSLGSEMIELLEFDHAGQPYADGSPCSVAFQHFALVVSDMRLAMQRLSQISGWTAISAGGPQHLPQRSGGVTAFKFRDPDGHPLEFLEFPAAAIPVHWRERLETELVSGIDHSAISVADTERSRIFFERLGFSVASQNFNHGIEQERLDGIPHPSVEVTALEPHCPTPHIELLCYKTDSRGVPPALQSNDVAATRLILDTDAASSTADARSQEECLIADPDGHRLQLVPATARGHSCR